MFILEHKIIDESVNVTFDETKFSELHDEGQMELLRFENQGFLDDKEIVNDEPTYTHTVNDGEVAVKNLNEHAAQLHEVSTNHPTNDDSGNMDNGNEGTSHSEDTNSTDQVRDLPRVTKWNRDHTNDLIIGNPSTGVKTRRNISVDSMFSCFLSQNESRSVTRNKARLVAKGYWSIGRN